MGYILSKINISENMSEVYAKTLIEMARNDKRIVALDADLMICIGMTAFQQEFKERMFNCGVQEANMIGVAAGLSATGKIPFAHSFGCFATRRCFDQIFVSAAYAKLNIKIIGSDPGVVASYNGGTHMPFEDMGIMRNIPNATVVEPVDSVMLKDILKKAANLYGIFYIRLMRKSAIKIYEEGSTFEIGKGVELRDGKDVTIIATGILVPEALIAARKLEQEGISVKVVNIFTLKPIDKEIIINSAKKTGAIVTAENHNIINGLGSAVAEVLVEGCPVPLERIGCLDLFGEVGPEDYLRERFKMRSDDIIEKVYKVLQRKNI
jgi:transketolase